jgi:4-amino-4-deoxy-L-arabinose transferase-like glycosyltransferase
VAVGSALLGLFGRHYWVLRVTSAVSGVVLVFATYRLASVLFNRRVGLGAAFLVSVNHVLLLYSRQSYVLDPAPFFVLALYCAVVGLERGSRFAWCLAGVLSGWTLLTYWASTALAFVGAAIFAGFVVFYARSLWRRRMGLLWMVLGLGVVYLPMLSHMKSSSNLSARLRESTVIFDPGGSIQRDPSFWRSQIGRTFGTILQLSDQSPWGIWTYKPILIGIETVLFGVGLAYLLVSGRRAPTLLILIWLTFGFFLGNGLFRDPEVLYHCLAAIPPILILCAVAVDRLLALGDPIRSPLLRALPASAAVVLLAFIGFLNFRTAWGLVGRPAAHRPDGRIALRADVRSIVPRFVREHPTYRYYLVRTPTELSSAAPSFIFFGDDSDLTDVTEDLSGVLPVPPGVGDGAAFVVLPGRSGDSAQVRAAYPTARTVEWIATDSPEPVRIHLVDEAALRRAYEASRRR